LAFGDGAADLRVVDQALNHVIAPRQFEGLDRSLQPFVQPRDDPFHPVAKEPADRGKEKVRRECHRRESDQKHQRP